MSECNSQLPCHFESKKPLLVKFSEVELSSDGGMVLVRQAEEKIGICKGLSECIEEWREEGKIIHSLEQLVSQRVYQLVGGYEDANDSNILRQDPMYKIACGRLPLAKEEELASQPTMSRLENQVSNKEISAMRRRIVGEFINRYKETPKEIVLDIDGWDDPTHGKQQLSCFHGYYRQHMYFPVLINEARSGYPLVLQLRPGNSHPGKGVAGLLRWLFWRFKRAWPGVKIILRADAGFSLPEILRVCERSDVSYAVGFARNSVLESKIDYLLEKARLQYIKTKEKARLFDDVYYKASSWDAPRRLVMKAEWMLKGANPRFVITNLDKPPQQLYDDFYVQRGCASEHPIKELKLGLRAERLSCHRFVANQFRLLLSQAAYILMITLRDAAAGTTLAKAQVERLRCCLIKCAAKVQVSPRRIFVELSASSPFAFEICQVARNLCGC